VYFHLKLNKHCVSAIVLDLRSLYIPFPLNPLKIEFLLLEMNELKHEASLFDDECLGRRNSVQPPRPTDELAMLRFPLGMHIIELFLFPYF
jgi:hypothetical protein